MMELLQYRLDVSLKFPLTHHIIAKTPLSNLLLLFMVIWVSVLLFVKWVQWTCKFESKQRVIVEEPHACCFNFALN